MFKTKNLVHDIKDVPTPWIFEHFCKLKEKLQGEDIKIKSLFNSKERTPSMCIYFDTKVKLYKYKDFSTGKGGSAIDLVKDLNNLSYHKACNIIVEQYNDYVLHNNGGYDVKEFKEQSKYKVDKYTFRQWTTQDQYFWTQFNIGSRILEEYCVRPLAYYTMVKDDKELVISGNYIYGYFTKGGELYKIYQPKTFDKKFLKIKDYLQGEQHLEDNDYLMILSSLKDMMSLRSLKLSNINIVAPDSENSMIKKDTMEEFIEEYKKVIVMFDNDEAGIKAMEKYKATYPTVEVLLLPMSKDLSDSIKDHGAKAVRDRLVPLINKKVNGN
jgi:5S rRNA maturation endonuclease (ribonuclease M5)